MTSVEAPNGTGTATWTFDTEITLVEANPTGLLGDASEPLDFANVTAYSVDLLYGVNFTPGSAWTVPGATTNITFAGGKTLEIAQSGLITIV